MRTCKYIHDDWGDTIEFLSRSVSRTAFLPHRKLCERKPFDFLQNGMNYGSVTARIRLETTDTDLFPSSSSKSSIFRNIWNDKKGGLLFLNRYSDDCIHNNLIGYIVASFFQRFSGGTLMFRFVGVDFAARKAP